MTTDVRVPDWAFSLEPESYATFRDALVKELQARGVEFDEVEGVGQRGETIIFFGSLVARASQMEPPWDELIAEHIDVALAAGASQPASDWDDARSSLRLALYPRSVLERGKPDFPYDDFSSDLIEVICIDRGGSIESVTHEQVAKWDVAWSELHTIAAANLRDDIYTRMTVEADETSYVTIMGTDQFASGRAAALPRDTPSGVVFAVPDRDHLLHHRVRRATSNEVIQSMARHCAGIFADADSPRSPLLHFAFGGEIHSWDPDDGASDGSSLRMPAALMDAIQTARAEAESVRGSDGTTNPYSPPNRASNEQNTTPFFGAVYAAFVTSSNNKILLFGPQILAWLVFLSMLTKFGPQLSSGVETLVALLVAAIVFRAVSLMTSNLFIALEKGRSTNWFLAFPSLRDWLRTIPLAFLATGAAAGGSMAIDAFVASEWVVGGWPLSMFVSTFVIYFAFAVVGAAANPFWLEDGVGYFEGMRQGFSLMARDPLRAASCVASVAVLFVFGGWCLLAWALADVLLKGIFVHAWSQSNPPDDSALADQFELF